MFIEPCSSHANANLSSANKQFRFLRTPKLTWNLSFRACPGTFPEPAVPGTCRSEPAPEPSWNPSFEKLTRNLPGTCRSEPAPEPSRNPWFGTCPGTFPEPAPEHCRNLPQNLPGTCPGTFPEPAPEPSRNLPRNLPRSLYWLSGEKAYVQILESKKIVSEKHFWVIKKREMSESLTFFFLLYLKGKENKSRKFRL